MLIFGNWDSLIMKDKKALCARFEVEDIGEAKLCLSI